MNRLTIKKQLSRLVIGCFLPVLLGLDIITVLHTREIMKESVTGLMDSNQFIRTYLDDSLDAGRIFIADYCNYNAAALHALGTANENRLRMLKYRLHLNMRRYSAIFPTVDFLFVYEPQKDVLSLTMGGASTVTYSEMKKVTRLLPSFFRESPEGNLQWTVRSFDGTPYLLYYQYSHNSYVGVLTNMDSLVTSLRGKSGQKDLALSIADRENRILASTEEMADDLSGYGVDSGTYHVSGDSVLSGYALQNAGLVLWLAMPKARAYSNSRILYLVLILATAAGIALFLYFRYSLDRIVVRPLGALKTGIQKIRGEDYSYQIEDRSIPQYAYEFQETIGAFNEMTREIGDLKIRVLEEQVNRQNIELNHYRGQMRPHTFINSLSTIAQFAQSGDLKRMNQYINLFAMHTRFLLSNALDMVTVEQEINQVTNYLQLQEYRLGESLFYFIDCGEEFYPVLIPRFLIYCFTENCIKHIGTTDRMTNILITVRSTAERQIEIRIEDNGSGFSEEMIRYINGKTILGRERESGRQLGCYNTLKILELQYHGRAELTIGNSVDGGAYVSILLPELRKEDESTDPG